MEGGVVFMAPNDQRSFAARPRLKKDQRFLRQTNQVGLNHGERVTDGAGEGDLNPIEGTQEAITFPLIHAMSEVRTLAEPARLQGTPLRLSRAR